MEVLCKPEHLWGRRDGGICIAEVGIQVGRSDSLDSIFRCSGEAWIIRGSEIRPECGVQGTDVEDVIDGGVAPVGGSFFKSPIRREELHDLRDRWPSVRNHLLCPRRLFIRNCERTDRLASIAYLRPVICGMSFTSRNEG